MSEQTPGIDADDAWTKRTWAVIGIGLALSAVFVMGAFWLFGLFDQGAADSGAKVVAAALALVGVLFTQAVVIVGYALKNSIDKRSHAIRQQELGALDAERNRMEERAQRDAHRDRVEISIRAVDLIGHDAGLSNPFKIGGALLALANLGEIDLAIALAVDLWSTENISDAVGMELVRRGLLKESTPTVQQDAAYLLFRNSGRISPSGDSYDWPLSDENAWPDWPPTEARRILAFSAAVWLRDDLRKAPKQLSDAAYILFTALDDEAVAIRRVAALSLEPLVGFLPSNLIHHRTDGDWGMPDLSARLEVERFLRPSSGVLANILRDLDRITAAETGKRPTG